MRFNSKDDFFTKECLNLPSKPYTSNGHGFWFVLSVQCSYLPCTAHTTCINLQPGYQCTACPKGFIGNSTMGIGRGFAENIKQVGSQVDCHAMN